MKGLFVVCGVALAGLMLGFTLQDREARAMSADEAEMNRRWEESMRITPHHEGLRELQGTWSTRCRFWMDPAAPAEESTGTATFRPIMDGRYVMQEFKGDMMGQPFEGLGIMGFNNTTQKHESIWLDSMGTMIMHMEGPCSDSCKTVTASCDFVCPMFGPTKSRSVTRSVSDKEFVLEMFASHSGQPEFRNMEITYTRR